MHINFLEKKAFDFNPKNFIAAIRHGKFEPVKRDLVGVVIVVIGLIAVFGGIQKLRLDLLISERGSIERSLKSKSESQQLPLSIENPAQINAFIAFDARIDWARIIDEIASEIPPEAALRSMTADSQKKNVEIVGTTDDHTAVASTLSALKAVKSCREVDLISSSVAKSEAEETQIVFTIQCRI